MKKLFILFLLTSVSCASFRHNLIPAQESLVSLLEQVSVQADKNFEGIQRQQFARLVMVPSIEGSKGINDCLLNNNCKNLIANVTKVSQALLIGINNFASLLPPSPSRNQLIEKLQYIINFVTDSYIKVKHEEVSYSSYPEMVIQ